jgi:hypothetical protein
MLNRICLGLLGLLLTFSAGFQLQSWWDKGEVWEHFKGGKPKRLVVHDLEPISYDLRIWVCAFVFAAGLCMVWVAMGGKLPFLKDRDKG